VVATAEGLSNSRRDRHIDSFGQRFHAGTERFVGRYARRGCHF
jgi:hypothetical protein